MPNKHGFNGFDFIAKIEFQPRTMKHQLLPARPAEVFKIANFGEFEFCLSRDLDSFRNWRIHERSTGLSVATAKTRQAALDLAQQFLFKRGVEATAKAIAAQQNIIEQLEHKYAPVDPDSDQPLSA